MRLRSLCRLTVALVAVGLPLHAAEASGPRNASPYRGASAPSVLDGVSLGVEPLASDAGTRVSLDATSGDGGGGMSPRVKAMLLSLVLPGLGQINAGHTAWGYGFLGAEAAIWASFAGFRIQADMREDRYVDFAERWGGVADAEGHDSTYYTNMGKYDSYEEYRVIAIRSDEGSPDEELYPEEQQWRWPSTERRRRFRSLVSASEDSDQRAELMIGFALLNRAIAVVHAARAVPSHREPSLSLGFRPGNAGELMPTVAWTARF